jgi:hypothetical protein
MAQVVAERFECDLSYMSKTRVIWARPRRFEQGKMVEASRQSKSKIKALRRATANGFSYGPKAWKKNS